MTLQNFLLKDDVAAPQYMKHCSRNIRNLCFYSVDVSDCKRKEKKGKRKYLMMPQHGDKRNLERMMNYTEYYH